MVCIDDALKRINEVIKFDRRNVRAHIMKGSVLFVLNQTDMAVKAWRRASQLEPNNEEIKAILENVQ